MYFFLMEKASFFIAKIRFFLVLKTEVFQMTFDDINV